MPKSQPDNKYRKDPSTFLNKRAWEDEIIGGVSLDYSIPDYINLASSDANELSIAVKRGLVSVNAASQLVLSLSEIMSKEQEYKEYIFNLPVPTSAISGKDHSVEQKILAFDSSDSVVLFINGQEVDSSTFVADANIIRFVNQITYNTYASSTIFVKVLVFSAETPVVRTLNFKRNVQGLSSCSWANIDSVRFNGEDFDLFTCESISGLDLNSRLMITGATVGSTSLPLGSIHFLLSKEPFHVLDRITSRTIKASELNSSVQHLKYSLVSKVPKLLVTSLALGDVFPAITPSTFFDQKLESATTTAVADDTSLNINISSNNKFILGPV